MQPRAILAVALCGVCLGSRAAQSVRAEPGVLAHGRVTRDVPEQPTAGKRTQMRFALDGRGGFEKYLGAWGHLLAASEDLIDMMHEHPYFADGSPEVEFEVMASLRYRRPRRHS